MSITTKKFGTTKNGETVTSYILKNENGMEAEFIDYGAILVRLLVPDASGAKRDIVLGYADVAGYECGSTHYGAFVGRNGNRIGGASFELNGKTYELAKNDGPNNLHSGPDYYENKMFEAELLEEDGETAVEFSRLSPDMEQGFPGNLDVSVTYTLTSDNSLIIEYFAASDADTIVNLTNHSYFNLAGHNSGNILGHKLKIDADLFAVTDDKLIPTGELAKVEDTPMDFRELKTIGDEIQAPFQPLKDAGGYDHHFVFREKEGIALCAEAVEETSGIKMEVFTDRPGVQFYAGNFIDGTETGKEGCVYRQRAGFCLETQVIPDAIHLDTEDVCILKAGEEFDSTTVYHFTTQ